MLSNSGCFKNNPQCLQGWQKLPGKNAPKSFGREGARCSKVRRVRLPERFPLCGIHRGQCFGASLTVSALTWGLGSARGVQWSKAPGVQILSISQVLAQQKHKTVWMKHDETYTVTDHLDNCVVSEICQVWGYDAKCA